MAQKKISKRHSSVPPVAKAGKKAADTLASAIAAVPASSVPAVKAEAVVTSIAPSAACTALVAALRGADADTARDAAASLGKTGEMAAVQPLIEVLSNRDGFFHGVVRAAAASSLAELGDARAVEPLLGALHDPMAETSAEAVRALATLGDTRAVAPLIEVLRNADGFFLPIVRRAAVFALAKLGGESATAELRVVAACDTEDAVIRQDAQQAIAQSVAAK